jgi:tight adherence protein C
MNLLIFLTVAPLLYWGIYLVARESQYGVRNWRVGRKSIDLSVGFIATSVLIAVGILFVTWREVGTVWICLIMVIGGYVLLQQRKAETENKNWQKKVDLELPGITQAITLMISAGISPVRAMQLVSGRSESLVAQELRSIVDEVMEGESAVRAIDNFARRVGSPGSRRFSNSISIAIERGTPLVPVLTALLKDAQVDSKNEMLRRAGKAEIALLLPVVFLLLPISVLFALFPSITQLQAF